MSRLVLALLVLLALPAASRADDLSAAVETLPPALANVQLLGAWEDGESRGVYRVVIARDGADLLRGRVFVQWLEESFDPPSLLLNASVEVEELTALNMRIADYRSETDQPNELVLHIDAVDQVTGETQNYVLLAQQPGVYRFKLADN